MIWRKTIYKNKGKIKLKIPITYHFLTTLITKLCFQWLQLFSHFASMSIFHYKNFSVFKFFFLRFSMKETFGVKSGKIALGVKVCERLLEGQGWWQVSLFRFLFLQGLERKVLIEKKNLSKLLSNLKISKKFKFLNKIFLKFSTKLKSKAQLIF